MSDAVELTPPVESVLDRHYASTRFSEGIFFNEIGIRGLILIENDTPTTWIALTQTMAGQLFFRSDKSRERVLEEFSYDIKPMKRSKVRGILVGLPIADTACAIRGAAKLLGIEVIDRLRLTKAIARVAGLIDDTIRGMSRDQLKTYNAAFKDARLTAKRKGEKFPHYQQWMVDQVGAMIQSGSRDKANFSRFLPAEPDT